MKIQKYIVAVVLAGALQLQAAERVVNWLGATNNYVTNGLSKVLNLSAYSTTDNGGSRTWNYSLTAQLNPQAGYTPGTGETGPFYGALEATNSSGVVIVPPTTSMVIYNGTAPVGDYFRFRTGTNSVVVDQTLKALVVFKKADFLAVTNGFFWLDATSTMNLRIKAKSAGTLLARMAVLNGSQWYLSSSSASAVGDFTISDCAAQNWGVWNPATAPIAAPPASFTVPGSDLTDIQAVGFYISVVRATTTLYAGVDIDGYTATMGAPLPGTVFILK